MVLGEQLHGTMISWSFAGGVISFSKYWVASGPSGEFVGADARPRRRLGGIVANQTCGPVFAQQMDGVAINYAKLVDGNRPRIGGGERSNDQNNEAE